MTDDERLKSFEKMLSMILKEYEDKEVKMKELKAAGKEKTVTFRQLIADKLLYQNILSIYRMYGLID